MSAATATGADHRDAAALATEAGELLLGVRVEGLEGKALKDEGDRRSNDLLLRRLAELHPDDAVLSEESADSEARLAAERVWIVDPLDGTREFSEEGRTDWAVHVALAIGGVPVAGAVALPAAGRTLGTEHPPALAERQPGAVRLVVSRTRPPACIAPLAEHLGAELVEMGSAGAKAMAVVQGTVDAYVHAGGQYEWDSCAPVAVAATAGLHVSRIDGSPLRYNQPNPYLPDLVLCRPELADGILSFLAGLPEDLFRTERTPS